MKALPYRDNVMTLPTVPESGGLRVNVTHRRRVMTARAEAGITRPGISFALFTETRALWNMIGVGWVR